MCLAAVSSRKLVRLVTLKTTKSVFNNLVSSNKLSSAMMETSQAQNSMHRGGHLKWSEAMNIKLLECKRKAIDLVQSSDPPRNPSGRKKGSMAVMKELWDESEFANDLNLSSQNLTDQAARIEKSLGNVRVTIRKEANANNGESLFYVVNLEHTEGQDLEQEEFYKNKNSVQSENLHTQVNHQTAVNNNIPSQISTEVNTIVQMACPIFASVSASPGDFRNRAIDTRTKKIPTRGDIFNINSAVEELMKLNQNNDIDSAQDPFVYLWLTNCVLYAVVAAFLMVKGWMRKNTSQIGKGKVEDEQKEMYERQAGEIQKNISIAKAEIPYISGTRCASLWMQIIIY